MVIKIIPVLNIIIFPYTYLERYLQTCRRDEFLNRLTPRIQNQERQFSPFYYKDPLVRDCVLELKERNNKKVARLFASVLSQYIERSIKNIQREYPHAVFYLVPIPQHISKTKDKGFLHTLTLSHEVEKILSKKINAASISVFECIKKIKHTKRLHDLQSKKGRLKTIKNTMKIYITKRDIEDAYFFIIDDVYTTGATFTEARRTLVGSGALPEHLYFISIAH